MRFDMNVRATAALVLTGTALLTSAAPLVAAPTQGGSAAKSPSLMVGTGKADITPPQASLPPGITIRDPLSARAIMVRDGKACAVLVGLDQGGTTEKVMELALPQVRRITGCAESNILISATHTHSGSASAPDGDPQRVSDGIVEAVRQASAKLQAARIGFGTVNVDLNGNRDHYDRRQRWVQADNPAGPSDKTMAVTGFIAPDGKPIALYVNYAMHPVSLYMGGVVSGDFAGGASRYLEDRYGTGTVAIFAQGASGDQNPRLLGLPNQLMMAAVNGPPIDERVGASKPWDMGPGGGPPPPPSARDPQRYARAYADVSAGVDAMAWTIGASTVKLLSSEDFRIGTRSGIEGAQASFACPGRRPTGRPIMPGGINETPTYADADPVAIQVGMLRIGDVYFASVDAEVYNEIATRLKRQAPVSQLMMVTLANGLAKSGYIYSDAAAERRTFQVLGSRLKPGCAEGAIVDTGLKLIEQVQR
jgi:hypothetical protein